MELLNLKSIKLCLQVRIIVDKQHYNSIISLRPRSYPFLEKFFILFVLGESVAKNTIPGMNDVGLNNAVKAGTFC